MKKTITMVITIAMLIVTIINGINIYNRINENFNEKFIVEKNYMVVGIIDDMGEWAVKCYDTDRNIYVNCHLADANLIETIEWVLF